MIITCNISKGGNGKTMSVSIISQILAFGGYRVLCVDTDPQSNLSQILMHKDDYDNIKTMQTSLHDLIVTPASKMNSETYSKVICKTKILNLDIIPACDTLFNTPYDLYELVSHENIPECILYLRRNLLNIQSDYGYDYILIDTCPHITYVTKAAMCAADGIIIPIEPDNFSYKGIIDTTKLLYDLRDSYGIFTDILGVFLTRIDTRINRFKQISIGYESILGDKFIPAYIRKSEPVAQSATNFEPLLLWDKNCVAIDDYIYLCQALGLIDIKHYKKLIKYLKK